MALASSTIAFSTFEPKYDCVGILYYSWYHPYDLDDEFELNLGEIGLKIGHTGVIFFENESNVGGSEQPALTCIINMEAPIDLHTHKFPETIVGFVLGEF